MKTEGRIGVVGYESGIGHGQEMKLISVANNPTLFDKMLNEALADNWRIIQDLQITICEDKPLFTIMLSRPL